MALVPHDVVIGGKKYFLNAPDIYTNIGDVVGIKKSPDSIQDGYDGRVYLREFIRNGRLFSLTLHFPSGRKQKIYCSGDKLQNALGALPGKTVRGEKIRTASIPLRTSYF